MVKEIDRNGKKYFKCEECKFYYKTRYLAVRCQEWCEQNASCNLAITKHAVAKDF
nr:hypothetical protein [Candidatus Woesearchaeota archaeon]